MSNENVLIRCIPWAGTKNSYSVVVAYDCCDSPFFPKCESYYARILWNSTKPQRHSLKDTRRRVPFVFLRARFRALVNFVITCYSTGKYGIVCWLQHPHMVGWFCAQFGKQTVTAYAVAHITNAPFTPRADDDDDALCGVVCVFDMLSVVCHCKHAA